ncbi:MAG: hypothetical protein NZM44_07120, partial [Candidatus Calescibacterium sp.]|nr:hypothetical protein [Candidatus Calescibacterium sp.]
IDYNDNVVNVQQKFKDGFLYKVIGRNQMGEITYESDFILDEKILDSAQIKIKRATPLFAKVDLYKDKFLFTSLTSQSVFGGVTEDIKFPEYFVTATWNELEHRKKEIEEKQKQAELEKERLRLAKEREEKLQKEREETLQHNKAILTKIDEEIQNLRNSKESLLKLNVSLLNFLKDKVERKNNNLGKQLLSSTAGISTGKSDTELYYEKLKMVTDNMSSKLFNNIENKIQELVGLYESVRYSHDYYKYNLDSVKLLGEIKEQINAYTTFIEKAFIIAHDGQKYKDLGKIDVSSSFYKSLKDAYRDEDIIDLIMNAEYKTKK